MLGRKVTNAIRFCFDEILPPFIRDSYWCMYPFFFLWFKGKNVKRFMNFKRVFHTLSEAEFEQYYKDYDSLPTRETDLSLQTERYIISRLGEDKKITILDVGCAGGYMLHRMRESGYERLSGVDLVGKSRYPDISIREANIEKLPFADNSFDTLICSHTLEHVVDIRAAIDELKRVAARRLIITVPCQRYYKYTFDLHIHFFPQASYLLNVLDFGKDADVTCENINGDFTVVANI